LLIKTICNSALSK